MFNKLLTQVTTGLDRRFLFNALFPCLLFAAAVGLLVARATGGVDGAVASWERLSGIMQAILSIVAVASLFFFASLISNSWLLLTQLYEGYLLPGKRLRAWAVAWQGHRRDHSPPGRRRLDFPEQGELLPTLLGNILLAAETYPMRRYGLESTDAWTRLYPLITSERRASLEDARSSMEFMLVISALAVLFAGTSGAIISLAHEGRPLFMVLFAGSLAVALLAYWGALGPARSFGLQVAATFDVHRLDLLRALHLPPPTNPQEEARRWRQVRRLFESGENRALLYKHETK